MAARQCTAVVKCAGQGIPAVYTNVSHYLPWLLGSVLL
jgi:hypothetical protein